MTDAPDDTSGVPPEREGRKSRVGDSGSPVGSTLSIILAVVAVIAGFLILRALTDDDSSADEGGTIAPVVSSTVAGATTTAGSASSTPGSAVTSTAVAETKVGATIVVANASGVGGSAGSMSEELTADGYEGVGEPGDSNGDPLPASVVYFAPGDPAAEAVAQSIAAALGGAQTAEIPVPSPASGGGVAGATVLVMLGTDAAGKTLAELAGGGTAGGGSVVPPPLIVTTSAPSTTTG